MPNRGHEREKCMETRCSLRGWMEGVVLPWIKGFTFHYNLTPNSLQNKAGCAESMEAQQTDVISCWTHAQDCMGTVVNEPTQWRTVRSLDCQAAVGDPNTRFSDPSMQFELWTHHWIVRSHGGGGNYDLINYGSGWRKDVVNQCLEFGLLGHYERTVLSPP